MVSQQNFEKSVKKRKNSTQSNNSFLISYIGKAPKEKFISQFQHDQPFLCAENNKKEQIINTSTKFPTTIKSEEAHTKFLLLS